MTYQIRLVLVSVDGGTEDTRLTETLDEFPSMGEAIRAYAESSFLLDPDHLAPVKDAPRRVA